MKFRFNSSICGTLLLGLSFAANAAAAGFYYNTLSGMCIDARGLPGTANGTPLQIWDCEWYARRDTDQIWEMTMGGFIRNKISGKCLDVDGAPGTQNGAKLQLWDCEWDGWNPENYSRTDQQWDLNSNGFLQNRLSGKCIDTQGLPGMVAGTPLQIWDCETSGRASNGTRTDQQWSYRQVD